MKRFNLLMILVFASLSMVLFSANVSADTVKYACCNGGYASQYEHGYYNGYYDGYGEGYHSRNSYSSKSYSGNTYSRNIVSNPRVVSKADIGNTVGLRYQKIGRYYYPTKGYSNAERSTVIRPYVKDLPKYPGSSYSINPKSYKSVKRYITY